MTAAIDNDEERREFGSLRLRGRLWWLRYRIDGKEHWESSRSTSKRVAAKLLARRQAAFGEGLLTVPEARRVSFGDLEKMLRTHYQTSGLRSLPRLDRALTHLRAAFGTMRAHAITAELISGYETDRLAAGAARATVNYELAALRKAFNLAVKARRLSSKPAITIPTPRNARTGFFEPEDFAVVRKQLSAHLGAAMTFAYLTGWRVPSEVLTLTWDRVDFNAGVVKLNVNSTKNDQGRTFPFDALPALAALLRAQRDYTTAVERETGSIVPYVFHRRGRPIRAYANAWRAALDRAAHDGTGALRVLARPQLLGRVPHDFRRTAVRNLVRAGVPERVAMDLCGHKTRDIFDRYNIVNEADLRAGVAKLAVSLEEPKPKRQPKRARGTKGGQSPDLPTQRVS